jgi:hypothetical protein
MPQTILTPSEPVLSNALLSFATQQGVAECVGAVLDMTRRVFPDLPITARLESDPEISDYRQIVMEINASGMDEGRLLAAQNRWSDELFQICPATHALNFRLSFA